MKTPVQVVKKQTTSREFSKWRQFFVRHVNDFHREDHYFAQLNATIVKCHVSEPQTIRDEDYMLTFEQPKPEKKQTPEERNRQSKSFWFAVLGGKPNG